MNFSHKLRFHPLNLILIMAAFHIVTLQTVCAGDDRYQELTLNTDGADKDINSELSDVRFIPVELFTGAKWHGKHELVLEDVSNSACASSNEKLCDNYSITGPYKTKENNTKIEWVGDEIYYYHRTFSIPGRGEVESHFTINNSKDGLVRIYDKREQWGVKTYSGLGSKFPLGYWKQGEVRTYATRSPMRIEIIELEDPNHCLTFRWTLGEGKRTNTDNNYTYCPEVGLTKISANNKSGFNTKETSNVKGMSQASKSLVGDAESDDETINNHCSPADNVNWVTGEDECLRIITLHDDNLVNGTKSRIVDTLVAYLHGDGYRGGPSDYLQYQASKIHKQNVAQVILMRPGYYDSTKQSSTGVSNRKSRRGTSYNAHNVKEIALAINKLKAHHKASNVIIVGHSGGAALAALILGNHPEVANAAVLAACPCNVQQWGKMLNVRTAKGALSPHEYVDAIRPGTRIIALTGTNDDNTFPTLARDYIELLKMQNINAIFIAVEGETHNGVVGSAQFIEAIGGLLQ